MKYLVLLCPLLVHYKIYIILMHFTNLILFKIIKNNNILKKKLKEKISHESSLQQSIALFPESESNVPKLEEANEKCKEKILKLETQWQRHKGLFLNRRAELQAVVQQNIVSNSLVNQFYSYVVFFTKYIEIIFADSKE